MGVVWYPCRLEPGVSEQEIAGLVREEALRYRAENDGIFQVLEPLVSQLPTPVERSGVSRRAKRVDNHILIKPHLCQSVYAVAGDDLFPLEWRLEAYRTILPGELAGQVQAWKAYREEVSRGEHRAYLRRLLVYLQSHDLACFFRETVVQNLERWRAVSSSWARQPAVIGLCEKILATPCPPIARPPAWPVAEGKHASVDFSPEVLRASYEQVGDLVRSWNELAQRGNKKFERPAEPPELEAWIAERLAAKRFPEFLSWVEPWERGGYGLYRDCE